MSVDLERFYEGMGAQADRVALPPLESIRRRGRRRRAVLTVTTAAPAIAVLAAVGLVWSILAPPPPPSVAGQGFLTFDGSARPVLRYDARSNDAMTVTLGNTVYARWAGPDDREYLAAIDLGTLKPLWGPVDLGRYLNKGLIRVTRSTVLAAAAQDSADQLVAVDPATGQVMWRLDYNFELDRLLLYDDLAIIDQSEQKQVAAVDLRTGGTRWAHGWTQRPLAITSMRGTDEFAELGGYGSLPTPADHRFVTHHADGRIQVLNGDNGQPVIERAGGATAVSSEIALDGKLYSATVDGVTEFDLSSGETRQLYDHAARRLSPCGPRLLCVLDDYLVAIDRMGGGMVWAGPGQWNGGIFATAAAIQVPAANGGYAVYGLAGKPLATVEGPAHWADDEHLLVWDRAGTVSAVSVLSGKRVVLGHAKWAICSWNRTMLACPTSLGISVWRYRLSE
jgi:putative pyrroloquinoline-quinone binding quinoprotein